MPELRKLVVSIVYGEEPISAHLEVRWQQARRTYRKPGYVAYRDAISWLMREQVGASWDTERYQFAVEARFFLRSRRKIDLDNMIKGIMDSGTGVVWKDDSQIVEVHAFKGVGKTSKVEIKVYIVDK